MRTHGKSKTPQYAVWKAMKQRCLNKRNRQYPDYGGRGIRLCKRWLKYENFFDDMGRRPNGPLTIERRNNNRGYTSSNCYWATQTAQGRNKRNNRIIKADGKSMCLSEWAEAIGIQTKTLHSLLKTSTLKSILTSHGLMSPV